MLFDFHLHTNYSDGELPPAELIAFVRGHGVRVAAVTDHDTVDGLDEAVAAGARLDITVIPGIELTTHLQGIEVHILGLGIDASDRSLRRLANQLKTARLMRLKRILARLRDQGVMIHDRDVFTEADLLAGMEAVTAYGRPHIARALCARGYAETYRDAFERYLGNACPAYLPKAEYPALTAIQLVKRAGGITILAHPEATLTEAGIDQLVAGGLDGIEVYCAAHDEMLTYHHEVMARSKGLLVTAGTDMHSPKGYELKLAGLPHTPGILESLRARLPQLHAVMAP
jgi:3',5'-nucleoside bisphosphate phosphatase